MTEEIITENTENTDITEYTDATDDTGAVEGIIEDEISEIPEKPARGKGIFRIVISFLAGFAACIALISVLTYGMGLGRIMNKSDWEYYHDLDDNYGKYATIMKMIGEDPLSQTAPETISDEVLKEIVADTGDPYAEYFTAEEYKQFEKMYTGDYVGVGIGVTDEEGIFYIRTVYDNGPASRAGLEPGDIIFKVDGVTPESLDDAVARMTGEAGTEVTVTVDRNGEKLDFKMVREAIELQSVGWSVTEEDPEVGYIVITVFRRGTAKDFSKAVKELKEKGCTRIILDLRNNGGGLTDECIEIADQLLPACRIMTDVSKSGSEKVYNSEESSEDLELVVLVNRNTASASEILTAALSENGAAVVIGEQTYGKGVTQVSRSFSDGSAVKLTVTEYLTPKGNHVQGNGIKPDIEATDEDAMEKALAELKN